MPRAVLNNQKRYKLNANFFDRNSETMEYIYGLWLARGYIYNNVTFDLQLQKKDKYILKLVAKELGYQNELLDPADKQIARITFNCLPLCEQLKTVQISNYNNVLRGILDGVGKVIKIKGNRINTIFDTCTQIDLLELKAVLNKHVGISSSFDEKNNCLKLGNQASLKLAEYIYSTNSNLFLLRKKNKFY